MYDAAQRVSIVIEHQDDEQGWAAIAMLIDERGQRRRTTLARFPEKSQTAAHLEAIFGELPKLCKQLRS